MDSNQQQSNFYNSIRYTNPAIARMLIADMPPISDVNILCDVGAGSTGVWGLEGQKKYGGMLCGIEIRPVGPPAGFNWWIHKDFFDIGPSDMELPDLWVFNPPFDKAERIFAHIAMLDKFVRGSFGAHIMMFASIGFLEGKVRRKFFEKLVPNKIVCLDGRLIDRSPSNQRGVDKRGRCLIYWDMENRPKMGETRFSWVGSNDVNDYRTIYLNEPGYDSEEQE